MKFLNVDYLFQNKDPLILVGVVLELSITELYILPIIEQEKDIFGNFLLPASNVVIFLLQHFANEINAHRPVVRHLCDKSDVLVELSTRNHVCSSHGDEIASAVNDIISRYEKMKVTLDEAEEHVKEHEKKEEQYNEVLYPVKETMSSVNAVLKNEMPNITEPELAKEEIIKIEVCW